MLERAQSTTTLRLLTTNIIHTICWVIQKGYKTVYWILTPFANSFICWVSTPSYSSCMRYTALLSTENKLLCKPSYNQQNAWRPVMARPRIRAVCIVSRACDTSIRILTVDVALALVGLSNKQVRHVPTNTILIRHSVSTKHFLEPIAKSIIASVNMVHTYVRALIRARSQFCLLIMEIISGAALPSSFNRPTW